jgi:hypothetical protein
MSGIYRRVPATPGEAQELREALDVHRDAPHRVEFAARARTTCSTSAAWWSGDLAGPPAPPARAAARAGGRTG